jgi:hypothetical protein
LQRRQLHHSAVDEPCDHEPYCLDDDHIPSALQKPCPSYIFANVVMAAGSVNVRYAREKHESPSLRISSTYNTKPNKRVIAHDEVHG